MHIGILGTRMVGQAISTRLTQVGHDVRIGSRDAGNPKARNWVAQVGPHASHGTFADAAAFGEVIFNCTSDDGTLPLRAAGEKNLSGKLIVDVANRLNMAKIPRPELTVCNDDSLGERIQREFPSAKVVKSLPIWLRLMVGLKTSMFNFHVAR